jgi:hypothetical protein
LQFYERAQINILVFVAKRVPVPLIIQDKPYASVEMAADSLDRSFGFLAQKLPLSLSLSLSHTHKRGQGNSPEIFAKVVNTKLVPELDFKFHNYIDTAMEGCT